MQLIFNAKGILERGRGLTFDDVLLSPQYSEVTSRRDPSLASNVTKRFQIEIPIVTANMDTITEEHMACAMSKLGGLGILHRFMDVQEQVRQLKNIAKFQKEHGLKQLLAASIGVKEDGHRRADFLADAGANILTVDIAHGDSILMHETLDYVKKKYPHIDVIAGNVASIEAVKRMADHGADAIKVGIGPGSMCTTRIITGHGVPQLTAIALCAQEALKYGIPVIADGGIRNSGDMVKALGAGASTIMVGSLVSGTLETPGEVQSGFKRYRGMASKDAQVSWRGELPKGMAAEGEATMIPCKGSVEQVIFELTGGIRSGMTYMGVERLAQMPQKALFMEMSPSGLSESKPHGVRH